MKGSTSHDDFKFKVSPLGGQPGSSGASLPVSAPHTWSPHSRGSAQTSVTSSRDRGPCRRDPGTGGARHATRHSPPFEVGGRWEKGPEPRPEPALPHSLSTPRLCAPLCLTRVPGLWLVHTRVGHQCGDSGERLPRHRGRGQQPSQGTGFVKWRRGRDPQAGTEPGGVQGGLIDRRAARGQAGRAVCGVQTKAEKPVLLLRVPQKPPSDVRALPSLPLPQARTHHPPPL